MLGKLMKYEIKAGLRFLPIVYIAIAASYLMGLLAKSLDIIQIRITMSLILFIGAFAAIIMTVVLVIIRYFKGLFGAEGYLTQTLPVGKGSLILSKVIAAYLWTVISTVAAILAFLAFIQLNADGQLNEMIDLVFGGKFAPFIAVVITMSAVKLLTYIGEIYFAITLANTRLFLKNNIVFSILFYFIVNFAEGLLEIPAMFFIPLGISISNSGVAWSTESMAHSLGFSLSNFAAVNNQSLISDVSVGVGSIFVDLLAGITLLLLSRWLLTYKSSVK